MVTAPATAPPCTTGNGNSPPATKLAGLPLMASTFGSANICSRLRASNALMRAPRFRSDRNKNMLSASESVNCTALPWTLGTAGPNWPVVTWPTVFPAPVLNRRVDAERSRIEWRAGRYPDHDPPRTVEEQRILARQTGRDEAPRVVDIARYEHIERREI